MIQTGEFKTLLGENYTQEELTSLIDSNTFKGSMAYLKMSQWKN